MTVDDDPGVSRSVARDLRRRYGQDYRIVRAESGREALDALRELTLRGEQVAAILADYRMPEMNGIEFLERPWTSSPHARRALLTAYADTDAAIQRDQRRRRRPLPAQAVGPAGGEALPGDRRAAGDVARGRPAARRRDPRGRAPLVGRRASRPATSWPATRCPTAGTPSTSRRARGCWRRRAPGRTTSRSWSPRDGTALRRPDARPSSPARSGSPPTRSQRLLRPHRHRRRPGRARRGGLRRVRGAAHGARRAAGHRRAGRAELAHRELPGLPRRRVRRAAHRPGAAAGGQVRRRGAHRARRRRAWRSRGSARVVRFGDGSEIGAHAVVLATGVVLPAAGRAGCRRAARAAACSTARRPPRRPPAQGEDVYIVGGANSAGQAAVFFSRHAAHGAPCWCAAASLEASMSTYLIKQLDAIDNIGVRTGTEVRRGLRRRAPRAARALRPCDRGQGDGRRRVACSSSSAPRRAPTGSTA